MKKMIYLFSFLTLFGLNDSNAQCSYGTELDGSNQFLYSPFNNYDFSNFTLECWINVPNYGMNVHYISLYQNAYLVLGNWDVGSFTTWAGGLSPVDIGPSSLIPTTNTWHHVAFVYDGFNQMLYIDGVLDVATATTGTVTLDSVQFDQGLVVGARYTQSTQFVEGMMDEMRIWNVARSQADIVNNMNNLLTGTETGLVAYYQFDDGPGSTMVADITGNGNDLTLMNMNPLLDWPANNLTNFLTTGVTQNGSMLTADDAGATYQWLNCDSAYAPITGATNQSFTPDSTGNYAVEITLDGCVDTSACILVDFTSLNEVEDFEFVVFPNPASNEFSVIVDGEIEEIWLSDMTGRSVKSFDRTSNLSISGLVSGNYFVHIVTNRGKAVQELVVVE